MVNLEILGSIATRLHGELRIVFYALLPVMFCLAWVGAWIKNPQGSPDYIEILKRLAIACLLMVGFREISDTILSLTNGLAEKIGNMDTLENYYQMVREKYERIPTAQLQAIFTGDILLATVSGLSCLALFIVKTFIVAVYHFSWILLIILSPILLSFHVLSSQITITLFRSLIEVASWKILWAVMSAMLTAIPFGNAAAADHSLLTIVWLNIIVVVALLMTPFVVRSIVGNAFSAVAGSIGPMAVALPARILTLPRTAIGAATSTMKTAKRYQVAREFKARNYKQTAPKAKTPAKPSPSPLVPPTQSKSARTLKTTPENKDDKKN